MVAVLLLAFGAFADLVLEGFGSLHLRAATLRAAGGSARLGAHGMCVLRVGEAVVVWAVLCSLRRRDRSCCCCCCKISASPPSSHDTPGGLRGASPVPGGVGGSASCSSSALCEAGLANGGEAWPSALDGPVRSLDHTSSAPSPLKDAGPRPGASLLCTLSGWVCVLLGCFAVTGSVSSLLVAMGGRTAPGMLGEMFSHHGPLARRSVLGWSLPTLTWIFFEIGSAGALYIACLSLLMLARQSISSLWSRVCGLGGGAGAAAPSQCAARVQSATRLCAAGGAEPPLAHKLQSMAVHALALAISVAELCLNDLPVLWQHRTLALLFGCAFSLNILGWHAYYGRFTYLYADAPRTSSVSTLLTCVITPGALFAAFTAFASMSASTRVRG